MLLSDIIILFLTGLAGGFAAGFLGIGGGVIYIIILPGALAHFGIASQEMAQFIIANSLFGVFFASLSGSITQVRLNNFHKRESFWVSVPGAVASLSVLGFVVITPWYSRQVFTIVVVCLLIYLAISQFVGLYRSKTEKEKSNIAVLSTGAALSGALSSLSGLGGGALLVPVLNAVLKMDIKKAKSISLVMIVFTSLSMTIMNMVSNPAGSYSYSLGYIVFPVALPMAAGVVIASPFGVNVGQKVKPGLIRIIFVLFLLIVIVDKILELSAL